MLGVAYWLASKSLLLAGGVMVLMALGHAWFLALELLLLPTIARDDPAPCPSRRERLRAWMAEAVIGWEVFAWHQPFRSNVIADRLEGPAVHNRTGIVFVHGFGCNRGFWTPWLRRLQADGRAYLAINLEPPFGELDDYADQIEAAVQEVRAATGRAPMIVAHSMGGLAARAWLRKMGTAAAATRLVTIATPHAGTWIARFSRMPNGRQMRIGSDWLCSLNTAHRAVESLPITCWWSNCDNVVMPASKATLPGADNRLVRGRAHIELAFDPQVIEATLGMLEEDFSSAAPTASSGQAPATPAALA